MIYEFKNKKGLKGDFNFLTVKIEDFDLAEAYRVAILKSQYTNNANQWGEERKLSLKIDRQLQGSLAEIAVQQLIQKLIVSRLTKNFPDLTIKVLRYDEVRTDGFKFSKGEFDLKIIIENVEKTIEVRSSKIRNNCFESQKIIGKYNNNVKTFEKPNDYYIKPVFLIPNKTSDEVELIPQLTKDLNLFIVGGCNLKDMQEKSIVGTLGNSNTNYQLKEIDVNNQIKPFLTEMMFELSLIAEQQHNIKINNKLKYKTP